MSTNQKFNDARERLVITAQRIAGNYLLAKYGSAHLVAEPVIELTHRQDEVTAAYRFSGKITCYASDGLLNQVGVNMTINENDIEVTSEDVQSNVTNALNANESNKDVFVAASLDGFSLKDIGDGYLAVGHKDIANIVELGIVSRNEYEKSASKSELLQTIVKDAFVRIASELPTSYNFTGEFKEPTIELTKEAANRDCVMCARGMHNMCQSSGCSCTDKKSHSGASSEKHAALESKSSWLTAELMKAADEDEIVEDICKTCDDAQSMCKCASAKEAATILIQENMPRAHSADHLVQSAQADEQSALDAQLKVEHEAANDLVNLLHGMGYGSAKAVEITSSKESIDIMTAVDHNGSIKAVSIPVAIKEGKHVLPKKALISTLIEKGLNVQQKLAEQFDIDTLEKLAAIDERMAYEANEVSAILSEKSAVEKTANEGKNTMFEGDTDTLTVQKHLLPNHEDLKIGDKISDGSDQWELVNTGGQQNSKGEDDGSLWTMKKCTNPVRSDEEPKNKMPI